MCKSSFWFKLLIVRKETIISLFFYTYLLSKDPGEIQELEVKKIKYYFPNFVSLVPFWLNLIYKKKKKKKKTCNPFIWVICCLEVGLEGEGLTYEMDGSS